VTKILFALALACLLATTPAPRSAEQSSAASALDKYLTASTELGRFSGAVLVAKDGVILLRKAYGYSDIEKRIPYSVETQSEIASLSKMFTAMSVLKLRDRGTLRLEGSVCDYLDDCPEAWKTVTIEEVMRHTSGITDYEDALDLGSDKYMAFMREPGTSRRILENAKKLPLDFKPGEKFKYSNTGYVVLGFIVQQVSKQPFGEFLAEQILKPAGMSHSGVIGYGPAPTLLARGYTHGDLSWPQMLKGVSLVDEDLKPLPSLPLTRPHGDAGMYSTLDDLYRWSLVMDGGSFVSASEIAEVFSPGRDGYGYGWVIGEDFGQKRYQHTGVLPGFLSSLIKFPAEKLTIVIMSNLDRARTSTISGAISAIALNKPYDMPVTGAVVKLTNEQQAALVGVYKLADGKNLSIEVDGESVSAEIKGQFLAGLIPLSAIRFYMPLSDGTMTFDLGDDGKAKSVNMHYKGVDRIGQRGSE
jgi:CubicO group peptidase (beta-lactamase class C family)